MIDYIKSKERLTVQRQLLSRDMKSFIFGVAYVIAFLFLASEPMRNF